MVTRRDRVALALVAFAVFVSSPVASYTAPGSGGRMTKTAPSKTNTRKNRPNAAPFAPLAVAAAIFAGIASPEPAFAMSKTAAQININSIPPTKIVLKIGDLPVLGNLLSGTYARLDTEATSVVGEALGGETKSSVLITSPPDKVAAIKELATKGHLEFDVGGILDTHLDVDVATMQPGELTVKVSSPLIPSLPFKNKANAPPEGPLNPKKGGTEPSDWTVVTNLGDGTTFYANVKTGVSQFEKPTDY